MIYSTIPVSINYRWLIVGKITLRPNKFFWSWNFKSICAVYLKWQLHISNDENILYKLEVSGLNDTCIIGTNPLVRDLWRDDGRYWCVACVMLCASTSHASSTHPSRIICILFSMHRAFGVLWPTYVHCFYYVYGIVMSFTSVFQNDHFELVVGVRTLVSADFRWV